MRKTALALILLLMSSKDFIIEEEIVINKNEFEKYVIRYTLEAMEKVKSGVYSEVAVQLLLGTMAKESDFGYSLVQRGVSLDIGAKGVFQVESNTNVSTWNNYLRFRPELAKFVRGLAAQHLFDSIFDGDELSEDFTTDLGNKTYKISLVNSPELDHELITNMKYGLVIARIKYKRVSELFPKIDDPDFVYKIASYWDRHYNINDEHGTPEEFIFKYNKYVVQ